MVVMTEMEKQDNSSDDKSQSSASSAHSNFEEDVDEEETLPTNVNLETLY